MILILSPCHRGEYFIRGGKKGEGGAGEGVRVGIDNFLSDFPATGKMARRLGNGCDKRESFLLEGATAGPGRVESIKRVRRRGERKRAEGVRASFGF